MDKPEALRLADWLGDQYDKTGNCEAAADMLHALYVENELLRDIARLYDQLRVVIDRGRESITHDVAVEAVRRLHDENETLRKQRDEIFTALMEISMLTHLGGEVAEYGDVVDAVRRLREEKAGLLEALRLAVHLNERDVPMTDEELRVCRAAIARAEGEKT